MFKQKESQNLIAFGKSKKSRKSKYFVSKLGIVDSEVGK